MNTVILTDKNDTKKPLLLRAGPLHLIFENGIIRSVCYNTTEIVRRVYMAVRDELWNTISFSIRNVSLHKTADTFSLTFSMFRTDNSSDFEWEGNFTGSADGCLRLTFSGVVKSTFKRNRIGWCILHPLAFCNGAQCEIGHTDGSVEKTVFPGSKLAPWQPFDNVQSMTMDIDEGATCTLRYSGDVFEMEDQRNWTDASFKTYSTPQSLPSPVIVEVGTRIEQSVELTLSAGAVQPLPEKKEIVPKRVGDYSRLL